MGLNDETEDPLFWLKVAWFFAKIFTVLWLIGAAIQFLSDLDGCDAPCEDRKLKRRLDNMSDAEIEEWYDDYLQDKRDDSYRQ
jgi:hypothetical protein